MDTEDIFKGYLFSQDSRELTRSLWQKNKRDVLRLNGVTQSSEEKRYPLMKLYEHFFYCDLYLPREGDCEYSTLKFGENFCLTSGFESGSTKYYEGSHLIEAIRDRDYLQNVLSRLNKCVEIMTDIIESEGPSTPFKDKFICAKKVDSIDIQNCHSMLKKILMEKEVIPKILAFKKRKIIAAFNAKKESGEPVDEKDMFTQLALVNKTAVNKLEEFESLISQRPELLQKCIIFVQTMEYGAKLQEILVRYSDKYHTYYADDEKINLENFAAGKIDCLLTCKKVSEGIDISSVTNIILFSSDRSRLVTTQRIGRALRLDKNNPEKKATVVDFVIEDSEENDNNADADRAEWLTELSQTRRCEHEK